MTTLKESRHAGEFIVSKGNGDISVEVGVIAQGQNLPAGAVLGQLTANGEYAEYDPLGVDGSETAVAVLYDGVNTTDAATSATVVARLAEVKTASLGFADGVDEAAQADAIADLAAKFIIAR